MGKLLDQLRDSRDRREDEVREPVIKIVNEERRQKELAVSKYHEIEFKLGQDIIKYAMDLCKDELARSLNIQFAEMISKGLSDGGVITFTFDKSIIRTANPDRILRMIFEDYIRQSRPILTINTNPVDCFEVIYIKIPELNLRVNVIK